MFTYRDSTAMITGAWAFDFDNHDRDGNQADDVIREITLGRLTLPDLKITYIGFGEDFISIEAETMRWLIGEDGPSKLLFDIALCFKDLRCPKTRHSSGSKTRRGSRISLRQK